MQGPLHHQKARVICPSYSARPPQGSARVSLIPMGTPIFGIFVPKAEASAEERLIPNK